MSKKGFNLATARQMLADARDRGDWDGVRTLAAMIAEAASGPDVDPDLEAMNRDEHLGLTADELKACSRNNCDPRTFARLRLGS